MLTLSVTNQRPFMMWNLEKNNNKKKRKNTPRYLQQFRYFFFQPSHSYFTFCSSVNTPSAEPEALCDGTRPLGRRGWHEFGVRVEVVFPWLSLGSCRTPVDELEQHLLRDRVLDAIAHSHGSAVGIWKAFVYSLSHEDPAVVLKLALYNLIIILLQFFCYLNLCKRSVKVSNIKKTNILGE